MGSAARPRYRTYGSPVFGSGCTGWFIGLRRAGGFFLGPLDSGRNAAFFLALVRQCGFFIGQVLLVLPALLFWLDRKAGLVQQP